MVGQTQLNLTKITSSLLMCSDPCDRVKLYYNARVCLLADIMKNKTHCMYLAWSGDEQTCQWAHANLLYNTRYLLALSTTATIEDPSWRQALTEKKLWNGKWKVDKLKEGIKGSKTAESLWNGIKAAVMLCHPCPFAVIYPFARKQVVTLARNSRARKAPSLFTCCYLMNSVRRSSSTSLHA